MQYKRAEMGPYLFLLLLISTFTLEVPLNAFDFEVEERRHLMLYQLQDFSSPKVFSSLNNCEVVEREKKLSHATCRGKSKLHNAIVQTKK